MRRVMGMGAVLLVGLAAGLGIAKVTTGDRDGNGADASPARPAPATVAEERPTVRPTAAAAVDVGPGAPDARGAVETFLAAEAASRFDESYRLLSAVDRVAYRSSDGWRAAHEAFPPVVRFHVDSVAVERDRRATAAVALDLQPGLDEVVGLVPARAAATYVAVRESDGWRVAFDEGSLRPELPSDASASSAVEVWAEQRRRCEEADQYTGGLVAFPALADDLCGAAGPVVAGRPAALPDVDAARFVAAFGPDAATWSRMVELTSPLPLRAVVAPVGDRWLVIGLLQSTSNRKAQP